MTTEEAKEILTHNWTRVDNPNYSESELDEAFFMAIEALTNEWTPITESEPNTSDHVHVTYKWDEDDYEVSELDYWITKYEAKNGNAQCKRLIDHVIAWRYMPAPYRGGDAE